MVVSARKNDQFTLLNFVDETVFLVDTTRPTPRELELQRFRLTNAVEGRLQNCVNQIQYLECFSTIRFSPVTEVLKGIRINSQAHL